MRLLYQPANAIDANLLLHVLESEGIRARIDGEYLQGAMGELPAAGLLRVMVEGDDYERARAVVDEWEKPAASVASISPKPAPGRLPALLLGLALGAAIGITFTWLHFRTPVSSDGVDYNGDGRHDARYVFANQLLSRVELDRNLDGRIDHVTVYNQQGMIADGESDENFDGRMETRQEYLNDLYANEFSDSDGDGFEESVWHYEHGLLRSIEHLAPNSGLPLTVFSFNSTRIVSLKHDSNGDGTLDQTIAFDEQGRMTTRP